jgi:transposase-like protein
VQRTQNKEIKPGKLIVLRKPDNLTILLLDGKHFRVCRRPYTLYVALNGLSGEPLCWILLERYELREGYDLIQRYLNAQKCHIKAIVSDWHHGIIASLQDYYPHAIHQRCAAHVLQEVLRKLGGKRFLSSQYGKELWGKTARIAIRYDHLFIARMQLGRAKKKYPQHSRAWQVLERALPDIYQFVKNSSIQIPRTSNRIENFMGQLEQRLKTFRGMKTPETLIKIITSLIIIKWKNQPKN